MSCVVTVTSAISVAPASSHPNGSPNDQISLGLNYLQLILIPPLLDLIRPHNSTSSHEWRLIHVALADSMSLHPACLQEIGQFLIDFDIHPAFLGGGYSFQEN